MSTALVVLDRAPTLEELKARAVEGHRHVQQALVDTFLRAVATGKDLSAIRDQLLDDHGAWEAWIAQEWPGSSRRVPYNYMRLAFYEHDILGQVSRPTVSSALQYVAGLPEANARGQRAEAKRQEALRLIRAEIPHQEIAELLAVHISTVRRWGNPTAHRARLASLRRNGQAAKRALERERRDAAIGRINGPSSEAYALIRRAEQLLDRAREEASDRECRLALVAAYDGLAKVEDAICVALRIDRGNRQRAA